MELGVYSRPDGTGPLVLVALCLRPSIEAERLYGELHYQGVVDTDALAVGNGWATLLGSMLDASHAAVDRARAAPILEVMDVQAEPVEAHLRAAARATEPAHPGDAEVGRAAASLPTAYRPTHKPP